MGSKIISSILRSFAMAEEAAGRLLEAKARERKVSGSGVWGFGFRGLDFRV